MSKIVIFSLNGCGYSQSSLNILRTKNVDAKVFNIDWENKDDVKKKNNMQTFPQIFLEYKKKNYKIGGDSELKNIIKIINETKISGEFDQMVTKIDSLIEGDRRVALEVINHLKK